MTIEQRLARLEVCLELSAPGTQLQRVLAPSGGMQWCLSLGPMHGIKEHFYRPTVEECIEAAEQAFGLARQRRSRKR